MQRTQFVEVFRTRQRYEAELVLSELKAAQIRAWKQEHSLAGFVTDGSPFPVVASAALYTVSVPRPEMLKATAILARSFEEPGEMEDIRITPMSRFARYCALIVLALLVLGLVRDFVETLRAAS
jgi:hypothetical protein